MNPTASDLWGTPGPRAVVVVHGTALNRRMWALIGREAASACRERVAGIVLSEATVKTRRGRQAYFSRSTPPPSTPRQVSSARRGSMPRRRPCSSVLTPGRLAEPSATSAGRNRAG